MLDLVHVFLVGVSFHGDLADERHLRSDDLCLAKSIAIWVHLSITDQVDFLDGVAAAGGGPGCDRRKLAALPSRRVLTSLSLRRVDHRQFLRGWRLLRMSSRRQKELGSWLKILRNLRHVRASTHRGLRQGLLDDESLWSMRI